MREERAPVPVGCRGEGGEKKEEKKKKKKKRGESER
jgi:hypothetical protein